MNERADNFGITRLEQAATGTFGWQVRLQRRGVKFARYFADRGHCGWEGSLRAARQWRDEVARQLATGKNPRICAQSVRNSSGVVGVTKVAVSGREGTTYHFWQATWCPAPGERRCIRFSVLRHGDKAAFQLAVQARREGIGG